MIQMKKNIQILKKERVNKRKYQHKLNNLFYNVLIMNIDRCFFNRYFDLMSNVEYIDNKMLVTETVFDMIEVEIEIIEDKIEKLFKKNIDYNQNIKLIYDLLFGESYMIHFWFFPLALELSENKINKSGSIEYIKDLTGPGSINLIDVFNLFLNIKTDVNVDNNLINYNNKIDELTELLLHINKGIYKHSLEQLTVESFPEYKFNSEQFLIYIQKRINSIIN